MPVPSNALWKRVVGLFVGNAVEAIDLSQLRVQFQISAADVDTPTNALITVYNLKRETRQKISKEFTNVVIQAGYEGTGGALQIFSGTIVNTRSGKEDSVSPFFKILAADGDQSYNFSLVNQTLGPGANQKQIMQTAAGAMQLPVQDVGDTLGTVGGILPRGKVLFGLARAYAYGAAQQANARYSIQNGVLVVTSIKSPGTGQAIVLNPDTGLVGIPEATENGIEITCVINPLIQPGSIVQLDSQLLTQSSVKQLAGFPSVTALSLEAVASLDGLYRVIVAEHSGDTRQVEWHSRLTCLAITDKGVLPYG